MNALQNQGMKETLSQIQDAKYIQLWLPFSHMKPKKQLMKTSILKVK